MTRVVLAAVIAAALATGAARGTTAGPSADFNLPILLDGVDRVLASVDNRASPRPDPFGDDAIAFAPADLAARRATPVARGDDVVPQPLPETATWLMMILGFFGLSFAVRRRGAPAGDRVRFS